MEECAKQGIYACALSMPSPGSPVPSEWVEEISRHVDANKKDPIYLIGHSLGATAILRYLETTKAKNIQGAVFVSAPVFKSTKRKVQAFLKKPFDYEAIRARVPKMVVIHGDNDKSVSADQGKTLARELGAKLVLIKNGGHLNGSAGWHKLPQCRDALLGMINGG